MAIDPPVQRLRRGARISACYPVKSLPPRAALDAAVPLQEYISLLIRLDPHDVERVVQVPDRGGAEDAVAVDEACWIYEQLRCVCARRGAAARRADGRTDGSRRT
jgi:hypothetical protein